MATVVTATPLTGGGGTGSLVGGFAPPAAAFVLPRSQPNHLSLRVTRPQLNGRPGDRAFFAIESISGAWDHFILEQQGTDGVVRESPRTVYTWPQYIEHLTGSGSRGELIVFYTNWRVRGWDTNGDLVVDTDWQGPI